MDSEVPSQQEEREDAYQNSIDEQLAEIVAVLMSPPEQGERPRQSPYPLFHSFYSILPAVPGIDTAYHSIADENENEEREDLMTIDSPPSSPSLSPRHEPPEECPLTFMRIAHGSMCLFPREYRRLAPIDPRPGDVIRELACRLGKAQPSDGPLYERAYAKFLHELRRRRDLRLLQCRDGFELCLRDPVMARRSAQILICEAIKYFVQIWETCPRDRTHIVASFLFDLRGILIRYPKVRRDEIVRRGIVVMGKAVCLQADKRRPWLYIPSATLRAPRSRW